MNTSLPLRQIAITTVVPMFFMSLSRAPIAMISSLACTMARRVTVFTPSPLRCGVRFFRSSRGMISIALLLAISPACLAAHAVRDDADRQVREHLDVDGVLVVLAVVPQQAALADVERKRHLADPPDPRPESPRPDAQVQSDGASVRPASELVSAYNDSLPHAIRTCQSVVWQGIRSATLAQPGKSTLTDRRHHCHLKQRCHACTQKWPHHRYPGITPVGIPLARDR